MRAITLWQPWATMVALGVKKIETRSWPITSGPLAIHAAKNSPRDALELALHDPFYWPLHDAGYDVGRLPSGVVVAIVDVVGCAQITPDFPVGDLERGLGNYSPGRYAWHLANVRRVTPPLPARGRQMLWAWPRGDEPLHTLEVNT